MFKKLNEHYIYIILKPHCVILVSFGTRIEEKGILIEEKGLQNIDFKIMFDIFGQYKNCLFRVRLNIQDLEEYAKNFNNILIEKDFIEQQEILCKLYLFL